jgi:hypothetical protein
VSCRAYKARRQAQRETWIADAELAFPGPRPFVIQSFTGSPENPFAELDADAIPLPCPDDYWAGPCKVQRIAYLALAGDYDFVFKCDDDTYIHVPRLLASGFEKHDYVGWTLEREYYAQGGAGYWLSKRALEAIVKHGVKHYEEDAGVGLALAKEQIFPVHDSRYQPGMGPNEALAPAKDNSIITLHNCRPEHALPPSSRPNVYHAGSFRRTMQAAQEAFWR